LDQKAEKENLAELPQCIQNLNSGFGFTEGWAEFQPFNL